VVGYSALEVRQCDNLEFAENEFYETSGFSSAGVVQIQCLASDYFIYDSQLDSYQLADDSVYAGDSSITLDQLLFSGNYAGHEKHICSVEGFATVFVTDCTFKNNQNYVPQLFNLLSPFADHVT